MDIGVPKESVVGERRVALVPDVARKLITQGHAITVEQGAGESAGFVDSDYAAVDAVIAPSSESPLSASVVVKIAPPSPAEIAQLKPSSVLIGMLAPLTQPATIEALAKRNVTALALESIPRISRAQAMDALSSQATVAGYSAALEAAHLSGRFFPMLMTAAGTVPPAQVLVLGAGVAGLQAIATARRLGATVTGYDVRLAVAEQVRSLGAKFLELKLAVTAEGEGGYARALTPEEQAAQQQELDERAAKFDVVITTAFVPGRPAPRLISKAAVDAMKHGSVIVDLAGEAGGNCELSRPGETFTTDNGVVVSAPLNLPSAMAQHASQLYARNIAAVIELITGENGQLELDFEDEIIAGACLTHQGENRAPTAANSQGRQ